MEVDNIALGRIITLVPKKIQSTLRLSPPVHDLLQRLADRLGKPRPDIVELAITHLDGTLRAGNPVFIDPPPTEPATHKRQQRVG